MQGDEVFLYGFLAFLSLIFLAAALSCCACKMSELIYEEPGFGRGL